MKFDSKDHVLMKFLVKGSELKFNKLLKSIIFSMISLYAQSQQK